jgi:hypothetical protein
MLRTTIHRGYGTPTNAQPLKGERACRAGLDGCSHGTGRWGTAGRQVAVESLATRQNKSKEQR